MKTAYFGGGNGGPGAGVTSFNARTGAVVSISGDYSASLVTNDSAVAGATVKDALNTIATVIAGLVVGVSSVFGRAGAVVAANGDYTSSQVTNASAVTGTTTTAALNTLNTAIASLTPTSRILTGTSPIRIDGGNSADLSANRTISVLAVGNSNAGVAPQHAGAGDVGKALIATATASAWGTDFGANDLTTTGSLLVGATPRSSVLAGLIKIAHGKLVITGRNSANGGDRTVLSWGVTSNDGVTLGDSTTGGTYRMISSGEHHAYIGATRQYQLGIGLLNWQPDATLSQAFQVTGVMHEVWYAVQTGTIRNTSYWASLNAAQWNSANRCFYALTAIQVPIAAPAGGAYYCANTADSNLLWITPANVVGIGSTGFATKLTGAAGSSLIGSAVCLGWEANKLGLYTAAPVVQAARVGQGTNSTGVAAANRTMSDVTTTGLADPVKVNQNFSNLIDNMWNPLELLVHNIGLSA